MVDIEKPVSELSKQREIGENMSDSRQLSTLVKELDNTLRTVASVDEYLTRISKAKDILSKDAIELSEKVEKDKINLQNSLFEIGKFIQSALDTINISGEELDVAAEQLILFNHSKDDAIVYAEKELKGLEPGTYWARYWSGLLERLNS
ncbi:MAG: hypothetical protein ACJ0OP_02450 [Thermodesulfobacteriota bacterium]|jgi:hypothetical protein|nr:MAG: hypothetical protein EVA31_01780 [Candidatus Dadabacteria bacterium]